MTNRISALPAEAVTQIQGALDTIRTALEPHAVELSADDRRESLKLGDRSLAFVEKATRYSRERAELVPGFLDVDEMEADFASFKALDGIAARLDQLASLARDSAMVAGGEANSAALVFYRAVKAAAASGAPGADVVEADLGQRFERGPRSAPSPAEA